MEKKLPIDVKTKWLEALRSGKYKQGQGNLKTKDGGFCCLGVICDVQGGEWKEVNGVFVTVGSGSPWFPKAEDVGVEVNEVLKQPSGKVASDPSHRVEHWLAAMNDGEDKTFTEIADYIEKEL